jgi:hypothetical protein
MQEREYSSILKTVRRTPNKPLVEILESSESGQALLVSAESLIDLLFDDLSWPLPSETMLASNSSDMAGGDYFARRASLRRRSVRIAVPPRLDGRGVGWTTSTHSAYRGGELIPEEQRECVSVAVLTIAP